MKKFKIFRILIQIIALLFFPELISLIFLSLRLFFTDIFAMNFNSVIKDSVLLLVFSLSTIIFGRFFCGYLCIFGSLNDWIYMAIHKVFKIKYKVPHKKDKYLKNVKYFILIFLILLVFTGLIKISNYIYPWDAYAQIFNIANVFSVYWFGFILLLITIIGASFIERFFCRYFCPLGAWFSLISRFRILKMRKDNSLCGKCNSCTLKCSMGINLRDKELVNSGECIQCFKCREICYKDNIKAKISNKNVQEYLIATTVLASTIGINSFVDYKINASILNTIPINESTGLYKDGTYTGIGYGYRPNLGVSVTVTNGKIINISITSSSETSSYLNKAKNTIINEIIASQSTDIDAVSGATRTSNGIMEAVSNALNSALIEGNTETKEENSSISDSSSNINSIIYNDGTYTGIGYGYRPNLKVSVTIKSDQITNIAIVSSNETPKYLNKIKNTIINEIITSQSTDVDAVSGATRSSDGIMEAVNKALSSALK